MLEVGPSRRRSRSQIGRQVANFSPGQEINDSRVAGRQLTAAIQRGVPIHTIACPMRLQFGEHCVGTSHVGLMQFVGADVTWTEKHGGGWGIGSMLVMGAVNAAGNSRRQAEARRQATAQWRLVDNGQMWLTNLRLAIQASEWTNLWHEDINATSCDGLAIELNYPGMPPTRIRVNYADWWFVMLNWVAFSEVKLPPEPDLMRR